MKIRFVIPELWIRGGPRNVYELTMELAKRGHDASVLAYTDLAQTPGFLGGTKLKPNIPDDEVKFFRRPLADVNHFVWKTSQRMLSLIPFTLVTNAASLSLEMEEAIYCATAWQTALPVFKMPGKGTMPKLYFVQAYETTFSRNPFNVAFAERTYYYPLIRVTQSAWLRQFLEENYGGEAHYIGMGINHGVFRPANDLRHKPIILTVARSDPNKGFPVFVEAIKHLYRMRKDFEVVILGEKNAFNLNSLDFPYKYGGWISNDQELANLYQGSIFVNTGRHEALPMPPLEAMACGATVVMTDTYGAREYTVDNQNCLLAPNGDAKTIARQIDRALSSTSLREDLVRGAISTAGRYTWEAAAKRLESIVERRGIR
jgi:glycosyltransferase involved in cell wall biosynthesis